MADADPPPAMEEAMPITPDVVLDGDACKVGETLASDKNGEALGGEGDKVEEGAEPSGHDVVAADSVGIAEDPDEADGPEEGVGVELQTDEVSPAVDELTESDPAPTFSTTVDDPTEVDVQTYEITTTAHDLTKVGAALVDDDFKIISAGGVLMSDSQTGQEVGGGSLDDVDEAAYFVSDERDDSACMEKDVAVSVDGEHAQDEEPQMDVPTNMLNVMETKDLKSGSPAADEGTQMNTQVQTEDVNEAEGVCTISAAVTNEEGMHLVAATMTKGDSMENDVGLTSSVTTDERIQTYSVTVEDYNEEKVGAIADEDCVEEEGIQMDAVTMTGKTNEEGSIYGENATDEAFDGASGTVAPEEKVQMDEAVDDVPEEVSGQMDGTNLTGNDNEQKEVLTADDGGAEQDAMQMDAIGRTNKDPAEGINAEDVVGEAVDSTVGDDVPEEEATHVDEEDDDDEPPPLLTKKGEVRRKRGRPSSKAQAVVKPSVKKDEEEVCFICFDGGDLVICDRRSVPHT
jgi:hypothetical protein